MKRAPVTQKLPRPLYRRFLLPNGGHWLDAMFKRSADLFSDEERRERQRSAQDKRREWKKPQAERVVIMPRRAAAN